MSNIKASVGHNGTNLNSDVKITQGLLNDALKRLSVIHQAFAPLGEDGRCGKLTIEAIYQFQLKVMKTRQPDKRIDPGKRTWKRLNQNIEQRTQLQCRSFAQKPVVESYSQWLSSTLPMSFLESSQKYLKDLHSFFEIPRVENVSTGNKNPAQKITTTKTGVKKFRQGDSRWGKQLLGESTTGTIHGYGCAMTSLTMAATYMGARTKHWPTNLKPSQLTPDVANNIIKKAGAYTKGSYMLWIVGGAKALGMDATDSGIGKEIKPTDSIKIDATLKTGLVLAHVNYKKNWIGDHWILLTDKTSTGSYTAIDPAYGKNIQLYSSPEAGTAKKDHVLLYGRSSSAGSSASQKVQNKLKQYELVRFVVLK